MPKENNNSQKYTVNAYANVGFKFNKYEIDHIKITTGSMIGTVSICGQRGWPEFKKGFHKKESELNI